MERPHGENNEGTGGESLAFVATIENLQSNILPYYRIVSRDPDEARRLVDDGCLHTMITIPSDFDGRISGGETPYILALALGVWSFRRTLIRA